MASRARRTLVVSCVVVLAVGCVGGGEESESPQPSPETERTGDTTTSSTVRYRSLRVYRRTLAGNDFEPVSGTATFAPGQTHATIPVTVMDDDRGDNPEVIGRRGPGWPLDRPRKNRGIEAGSSSRT